MKRLGLRHFSGVKFLRATPNYRCGAKRRCKLRYRFLSQVIFWVVLGFTGKAWCSFIPDESLKSGRNSSDLGAISLQPPTESSNTKFPIELASPQNFSHQAKDLAPLESSEGSAESGSDPAPIRAAFMPEQTESISTTQIKFPRVSRSPVLSHSRCWRSSSSTCTYRTSTLRIAELPKPQLSPPDPEIGLRSVPVPDPELGTLQIQPLAIDPPVGAGDPELGTLRLQDRATPQPPIVLPTRPRQPTAYLLARADYFKSSNVFSDIDPVDDGLLRTGLTFFYAPPINARTFVITSLDANLIRYGRLGQYRDINGNVQSLNYDELRLRVGVFYRITPRLSGEVGWSNQKLFASGRGLEQVFGGREFFGDNSLRVELTRQDALSPRLSLTTYYQFRWSLANPNDRSRILNSVIATLGYNFSPRLQTAIDYQFTWSHFTQQARDDLYHQLIARVTYNLTPRTQINLFSGYSFGSSSDRRINFDSFIFGAGLVFSLPLF